MARRIRLGLLAGTLALLFHQPVSAQTSTDVKEKASKTWEAIKGYSHAKQNDAVAHSKKLMKESDAKIKELEGKASKATGEIKVTYQKLIKDLKAKQAVAAKKLDEMGKSSSSAWDHAKEGFSNAYKDLAQSTEKAAAEFK